MGKWLTDICVGSFALYLLLFYRFQCGTFTPAYVLILQGFFFSMLNMNHECERECVCECVCMNSLCVVNSCVKCEFVATAAAMAVFCFYSDFLWRKTRNWMRASFLFIHTYSLVSFFCSLFLFLINQTLNYWVEHIFFWVVEKNLNTIEFFLHTF